MKYYKISEEQLRELIESSKILSNLEAYGVDNWGGYEEAVNEDTEATEEDLSEFEELENLGDKK